MKELTKRQRSILSFIVEEIKTKLLPPTIREIGFRFGIGSTNGVNDHLVALEKKGYIETRLKGEARGTIVTAKTRDEYNLWFKEGRFKRALELVASDFKKKTGKNEKEMIEYYFGKAEMELIKNDN